MFLIDGKSMMRSLFPGMGMEKLSIFPETDMQV